MLFDKKGLWYFAFTLLTISDCLTFSPFFFVMHYTYSCSIWAFLQEPSIIRDIKNKKRVQKMGCGVEGFVFGWN